MEFLDRHRELARLDGLALRGGLGVIYGRRRIGKTRLLVEWVRRHGGLYTVADPSAAHVQRRYLAEAVDACLPGFADVEYRDWRSLFGRLARDAATAQWRGPLVLDELPYLVVGSPELPGVLQRWIDHEAGPLPVVLAGSAQRMMQGLVLAPDAPLYGRAAEVMELGPLPPGLLRPALGLDSAFDAVEAWAAWGGVPRYWELAAAAGGGLEDAVDALVLDPLGPLHREPDRLILEEIPSAAEVRPLLDAIAAGAHRVSEIGARLGRPATSLARPLARLQGLGLVRREVPAGQGERASKRSLYRIDDPFTRLWFRVVAPHRGELAVASPEARRALFRRAWPAILGEAWEELCRQVLPSLPASSPVAALGPWGPASRWWHGNEPEWDVVARSLDGRRVLFGEAKTRVPSVPGALANLARRPVPDLGGEPVRVLFVADATPGARGLVTAGQLLGG